MRSPKKPTQQKKLEGTARKDRANAAEPQYEARLPEPPDCLSADALEEWHRIGPILHSQRVISEADRGILAVCCEAWAEFVELSRLWRDGKRFLLDEKGQTRKYPISKERREAMARYQSLCADLGLSPASRAKVSSIGQPPETDPLERLLRDKQAREQARTKKPERERVM